MLLRYSILRPNVNNLVLHYAPASGFPQSNITSSGAATHPNRPTAPPCAPKPSPITQPDRPHRPPPQLPSSRRLCSLPSFQLLFSPSSSPMHTHPGPVDRECGKTPVPTTHHTPAPTSPNPRPRNITEVWLRTQPPPHQKADPGLHTQEPMTEPPTRDPTPRQPSPSTT